MQSSWPRYLCDRLCCLRSIVLLNSDGCVRTVQEWTRADASLPLTAAENDCSDKSLELPAQPTHPPSDPPSQLPGDAGVKVGQSLERENRELREQLEALRATGLELNEEFSARIDEAWEGAAERVQELERARKDTTEALEQAAQYRRRVSELERRVRGLERRTQEQEQQLQQQEHTLMTARAAAARSAEEVAQLRSTADEAAAAAQMSEEARAAAEVDAAQHRTSEGRKSSKAAQLSDELHRLRAENASQRMMLERRELEFTQAQQQFQHQFNALNAARFNQERRLAVADRLIRSRTDLRGGRGDVNERSTSSGGSTAAAGPSGRGRGGSRSVSAREGRVPMVEYLMQQLHMIVQRWVGAIGVARGLSGRAEPPLRAYLFTFGSFRLGVRRCPHRSFEHA
jgi:membrane protein involved in colicin uptake|eukprot:COSAG01_NODE_3411_length_6127_cov_5.921699_5_plen_400_part_00